jgi:hypothetical protein
MKIKASSPHSIKFNPYKTTLACIKGNSKLVDHLVFWDKSPQGRDHWEDIFRGRRKMCFDDKVFLLCLSYSYAVKRYEFEVVVSDEALNHIKKLIQ